MVAARPFLSGNPGASHYEERYRNRVLGNLKRRAKSFGYDLRELPPEAEMVVSWEALQSTAGAFNPGLRRHLPTDVTQVHRSHAGNANHREAEPFEAAIAQRQAVGQFRREGVDCFSDHGRLLSQIEESQ